MPQQVTAFLASNGKVYLNEADALAADAADDLNAWASREGICSGGEWSSDMILSAMHDNAAHLWPILQRIAKEHPL